MEWILLSDSLPLLQFNKQETKRKSSVNAAQRILARPHFLLIGRWNERGKSMLADKLSFLFATWSNVESFDRLNRKEKLFVAFPFTHFVPFAPLKHYLSTHMHNSKCVKMGLLGAIIFCQAFGEVAAAPATSVAHSIFRSE